MKLSLYRDFNTDLTREEFYLLVQSKDKVDKYSATFSEETLTAKPVTAGKLITWLNECFKKIEEME